MNVRRFLGEGRLIVAAVPVAALARDCNEVKAEIDPKIKAKAMDIRVSVSSRTQTP